MVPPGFSGYFSAAAGVAGTLIGLLFVAVTIAPDRTLGVKAPPQVRETAANAFLVLGNALFLSLGALIPDMDLGLLALITVVTCLSGGIMFGVNSFLARHRQPLHWRWYMRRGVMLLALVAQAWLAWRLINYPRDTSAVTALAVLMLVWFAIGLVRSWELVGGSGHHLSDAVTLWRETRDTATSDEPT